MLADNQIVDAETILAQNIKYEAKHTPEIEAPVVANDTNDVTEEAVAEEFSSMEIEDADTILIDDDGLMSEDSQVPVESEAQEEAK